MTDERIEYREATPADHPYVAATARHQVARYVRIVPRVDLEFVTAALLGASRIVVACSPIEPAAVLGWCAAIGGVPWFVFVPRDLRHCGIGTRLRKEILRGHTQASFGDPHRRSHDGPADARPGEARANNPWDRDL